MFSMIQYKPFKMADYDYPVWATGIGWMFALFSVLCIPAGMIHSYMQAKGDSPWQVCIFCA